MANIKAITLYLHRQWHRAYPPEKRKNDEKYLTVFLVRRVSFLFSLIFAKLGVAPNTLSAASIGFGLFGISMFARASFPWGALGITLCWLFDTFDGEVSRLTNTQSKKGILLEVLGVDLQYLLLQPSLALGLVKASLSSTKLVPIAFMGGGLYMLFRRYWSYHFKDIESKKNLPFWQEVIISQLKPHSRLREENALGSFLFYLRMNLFSFSGILYPVIVFFSLWKIAYLPYAVWFVSLSYISLGLVTFLGILALPEKIITNESPKSN